jgi:hypothetical protein
MRWQIQTALTAGCYCDQQQKPQTDIVYASEIRPECKDFFFVLSCIRH